MTGPLSDDEEVVRRLIHAAGDGCAVTVTSLLKDGAPADAMLACIGFSV